MSEAKSTGRPGWATALHWFIVLLFSFQVLYSIYQVFVVLGVSGHIGPLGSIASSLAPEQLMARRLYAIEGWIAGGALIVYLALTEPGLTRR